MKAEFDYAALLIAITTEVERHLHEVEEAICEVENARTYVMAASLFSSTNARLDTIWTVLDMMDGDGGCIGAATWNALMDNWAERMDAFQERLKPLQKRYWFDTED